MPWLLRLKPALVLHDAQVSAPLVRHATVFWSDPLFRLYQGSADWVYGIKIDELEPENAVTLIEYPILVMHGEDDTRIPIDHGIRVHQNAHWDSAIWIVPDMEHADSLMTYPDEYARIVIQYFDSHLAINKVN